jgi:transcriptional regulator with XRE-family HTH domain
MASKLPHYLRTYRRRIGLSQDDVAFLLGGRTGTTVSRHERLGRVPSLRTLLAYEVILGAPLRDLFAGAHREVENRTRERARRLAAKMSQAAGANPGARTRRKLDMLRRIATGQSPSR